MRFYRNSYVTAGEHNGFSWHTSKRDADQTAAEFHARNPLEDKPETIEVDIEPTKAGILQALRQYASHNDNG